MPKDEFDPDDPMELCGMGLLADEDTTDAMTECFIEEFMRLGYSHKHIHALFRNPFYIGMNMVLQNKGEAYVKEKLTEVFARWGKAVTWPEKPDVRLPVNREVGCAAPRAPGQDARDGGAHGVTRPTSATRFRDGEREQPARKHESADSEARTLRTGESTI